MLFNSLGFVFLFLPLVLAGYYLFVRFGFQHRIFAYLCAVSLIFYSVWNPPYTLLLIGSMGGNYLIGRAIELRDGKPGRKMLLAFGIIANLAVLGWFKYANFFVDNVNLAAGTDWALEPILLPLAISFYTFQQIAYLMDIERGEIRSGGISRYATFVIFFPQLVAGPIVHYKEMMPQFFGRKLGRFAGSNLAIGLTIFLIGLFKKTVIADSAALYSTPIFDLAAQGDEIGLLQAWTAAITYTIQLYFDFSGYSDMAVGLARMFGIKLPPNFHSPLKAASIIEYWRRWHITLQQFIVSYMYQPILLPLTRVASEWRLGQGGYFFLTVIFPTVLVFILIGLWHGAAWTYVLFGTMHGLYLATNEFWRMRFRKRRRKTGPPAPAMNAVYHLITLLAVVFANVVFRAEDVASAMRIWRGMVRFDRLPELGSAIPVEASEWLSKPFAFSLIAIAIIAFMPNTQQFMMRYQPVYGWKAWREVAPPAITLHWRPTIGWAAAMALIGFLGIAFISRGQSEFIYFNF
jgi:alginate O-acetyltransferase complex protein AlgI